MYVARVLTRLRVPLGYALGILALLLARPSPLSLGLGLPVAALGEALRFWAAGHLVKGGELTRSGPYAWTRNPLYLGSLLLGFGFSLAAARWMVLLLFVLFFAVVYLPVIQAEAARLAEGQGQVYAEYARRVPLLFPRPGSEAGPKVEMNFSWQKVLANREHLSVAGWLAGAVLLWWKMG